MKDHEPTEDSPTSKLSPPTENDTPSQPPLLAPPSYIDTTRSAGPIPVTCIFPEDLTENDPRLELFDDRDGTKKTKNAQKEVERSTAPAVEEKGAPDGGWGWCIVLVAFFINLVLDGVAYSCGVYFPVFLDHFQESASKTAWIGSLCSGCYLAISPLAGAATNRYGCKKVSIFGCLWASASLLAASFANSVDLLIVTWGISTGCAFGFLYLPSLVIVGLWFDKKRGIATGITVAGTGVGLFVLPPLCTSLIKNFGWRVSLYALSGLVFLCAPLALLYRDVPVKSIPSSSKDEGEQERAAEVSENLNSSGAEHSEGPTTNNDGNHSLCEDQNGSLPMISVEIVEDEGKNVSNGDLGVPTNDLRRLALMNSKQEYSNSMWTVYPHASSNNNGAYSKGANGKSLDDLRQNESCVCVRRSLLSASRPNMPDVSETPTQQNTVLLKEPLRIQNIFYSASTANLAQPAPEVQSSQNELSIARVDSAREEAGTEGVVENGNSGARVHRRLHPNRFLGGILQMLGVGVFKDPCFILLLIMSVFVFFGFFTPFMYMTDYAILEGVDLNSASFLISITGIANTIGRPFFGLVVAMNWLDSVVIFNCSVIVCGALTLVLPFLSNYWMIALYASLFGLCVAGHICTRPLAITQLMGVKNLSNGLGYSLLATGVASMVGVPLIGLLYNKDSGSYAMCFIFAGTVMMVGGFLGLPLQRLSDRQRSRYPERYLLQQYTVTFNHNSERATATDSNDVTNSSAEVPAIDVNTNIGHNHTDA